ncbi:alpha/beta hydrolase-fold protein [Limibacter armeniacum]|uniref:alpha/beta hydrolase n=1 Tax=Limibacter armeniacum TaxID=466084 RepID=UPI002FE626AE
MKHSIFFQFQTMLLVTFILCLSGCQSDGWSSVQNSETHYLKSKYTNSNYRINVWYPEGYQSSEDYHAVYLLDGDDYFREVAEYLTGVGREDIVLIGIGYKGDNQRGRDFSYPEDDDFPNDSGGAKQYIQFLNHELIPFIEKDLNLNSIDNTLFGHSLGGYLSLYLLYQQEYENPFDYHIAASPNIMWYRHYLFELEDDFYRMEQVITQNIYVTVGDLEGVALNTSFDAFQNLLESRDYKTTVAFERLPNTTHRNSPIQSFIKGIALFFNTKVIAK